MQKQTNNNNKKPSQKPPKTKPSLFPREFFPKLSVLIFMTLEDLDLIPLSCK